MCTGRQRPRCAASQLTHVVEEERGPEQQAARRGGQWKSNQCRQANTEAHAGRSHQGLAQLRRANDAIEFARCLAVAPMLTDVEAAVLEPSVITDECWQCAAVRYQHDAAKRDESMPKRPGKHFPRTRNFRWTFREDSGSRNFEGHSTEKARTFSRLGRRQQAHGVASACGLETMDLLE